MTKTKPPYFELILKGNISLFCYCALSGALASFSLPPYDFMPSSFLSFGLFIYILDRIFLNKNYSYKKQLKKFTFAGWSFGFGYFLAGLWWLSNALFDLGPDFYYFIPLITASLPALLAAYWALACFMARLLWQDNLSRFFAFALAFGLAEWLRGHLLSGFPWNAIGYMLMPSPLFMQSASLIGLYGINVLAALLLSLMGGLFRANSRKKAGLLLLSLFSLHIAIGYYYLYLAQDANKAPPPLLKNENEAFTIRLLQPAISASDKFDKSKLARNFHRQLQLAQQASKILPTKPDLIIWPETAIPFLLDYNPILTQKITNILAPGQYAILGTVRLGSQAPKLKKQFYNSIEVLDHKGNKIAISDKLHLVPFGEYIPFEAALKKLGLSPITEKWGGYSAASQRRSVTLPNGLTYLPLICYEIVFPSEMEYKGDKPHFIINVTNDMWYGDTPGPYQHLQQARLRAVEQRLPVLRAANNGISAIIDPFGRIINNLSLNDIGVVDGILPTDQINIKSFNPGVKSFLTTIFIAMIAYFMSRKRRSCH